MTTKAERDAAEQQERMKRYADEFDPPRPWTIQERGWGAPQGYPNAIYVTDADGHVIPEFTCMYVSAMLRRIVRVVNGG